MSVRINLSGAARAAAGKVVPALVPDLVASGITGLNTLLPAVPPADRRHGDILMSRSSDGPHRTHLVLRAVLAS